MTSNKNIIFWLHHRQNYVSDEIFHSDFKQKHRNFCHKKRIYRKKTWFFQFLMHQKKHFIEVHECFWLYYWLRETLWVLNVDWQKKGDRIDVETKRKTYLCSVNKHSMHSYRNHLMQKQCLCSDGMEKIHFTRKKLAFFHDHAKWTIILAKNLQFSGCHFVFTPEKVTLIVLIVPMCQRGKYSYRSLH